MRRKPDTCKGCPLYKDGYGYVPDKLDEDAELLVISQFPSTYEARTGINRNGMVIEKYEQTYEKYAGPIHKSYAHIIRCRGQRGTRLPQGKVLGEGAKFCRQYDKIPGSTQLIMYNGLGVGKTFRLDIGVTQIQKWRGFVYPPKPTEGTE
jgi:hypothetical protein